MAAWPTKEITLIVPFVAGGPSDVIARAYQQGLEQTFKVPVVVKNMPGAAHTIAINHILNSENDGHTFLQVNDDFISGQYLAGTKLYENFTPVHILGKSPALMVFGGANSSQEKLLAEIKEGNTINVGTINLTGLYSLWVTSIQSKPQMKINLIPYKGAADILRDVLAGHLEYGVGTFSVASAEDWVNEGKIKPILHVGDARFKNIPTIKDLGMTSVSSYTWIGTFAKKGTPPEAIAEMTAALKVIATTSGPVKSLRGFDFVNLNSKDAEKFVASEISIIEHLSKNANLQKTVR